MVSRLAAAAVLLSTSLARGGASDPSEQAYSGARKAYYALKADAGRRRFRDAWLAVAHKFEAVASRYPGSKRAPDSLFTAGQLLGELSRISLVPDDLAAAVSDWTKLCEAHPRHRLADDAALALAKAQLDRLSQPDAARTTVTRALALGPKADQAPRLRALLASIPADLPKKAPAPKKPVVHQPARTIPVPEPDGEEPEDSLAAAAPEPPVPVPLVNRGNLRSRIRSLGKHPGGEVSLAAQLGLKVRRVVIDAGHGGHDAGAVGPGGTREKTVALAIAHRLSEVLTAQGLEVVLTRDDDSFVRLEDRARLANGARGDLFISIHCNSASRPSLHGVETYTLNLSSDRYAIRLAARENSASEKGVSDLQFLLADLATKANTEESNRLATRVQRSLVSQLGAHYPRLRDLGTKEALFYVLLGARMPAILVETSFLSNPEEEKRLGSPAYQRDVARAIAAGVQDFLGDRERLAKVN